VDLQRFGPEADGDVLLEGRYALLPAKDERPLRRGTLRHQRQAGGATPAATDPGAAVEIMNELLVEASREIAAALRSLPEAEASPSPTAAPPPQASPPRSAPQ
jgi:hypothetical protein